MSTFKLELWLGSKNTWRKESTMESEAYFMLNETQGLVFKGLLKQIILHKLCVFSQFLSHSWAESTKASGYNHHKLPLLTSLRLLSTHCGAYSIPCPHAKSPLSQLSPHLWGSRVTSSQVSLFSLLVEIQLNVNNKVKEWTTCKIQIKPQQMTAGVKVSIVPQEWTIWYFIGLVMVL